MHQYTLLAPHSEAVDILHNSLQKVLKDPTNERFRKVNVEAAGPFKERVASKPGAIELLYNVGYEPMSGHLVLQRLGRNEEQHSVHPAIAAGCCPCHQFPESVGRTQAWLVGLPWTGLTQSSRQ